MFLMYNADRFGTLKSIVIVICVPFFIKEKGNYINAKELDTTKLLSFSIPYLLSIRNYALRLDMYIHACLFFIHGYSNPPMPDYKKIRDTTRVAIHLCQKFPSQYLIVYGYLKGYQESLEINT